MNPITSTTNEINRAYFNEAERAERIEELYDVLDTLHTAASEDALETCTAMSESDLLDFLKELVFTAQETIKEIEQRAQQRRSRPSNIIPFTGQMAGEIKQ